MAVDVIYNQKNELARLLAKKYIPRENSAEGKRALGNSLIKVITGPRRAGKSVFCLEILAKQKYGYLNFDSDEVLNIGHEKIITTLQEVYPGVKIYFFDEIQNLPRWELFVNTLQRRGFNLILTGSNANLLSGELATHLTGRYQELSVYPFSFEEFLLAKSGDQSLLLNYLQTGGYPEVVMSDLDPQNYLSTLSEATIFKDIVKRHRVKYPKEIESLAKLLAASYTKQISPASLTNNLGLGSHHTIGKYLNYLTETYLFITLERFNFKVRQRIKTANKIYFPDTGFAATVFSPAPDFGKLLENAVFMKLVRRGLRPGKDLFYYQTKAGKEVDFLIAPNTVKTQLVQSCFDLSDPRTKNREESALNQASKELNCYNVMTVTKDNFSNLDQFLI